MGPRVWGEIREIERDTHNTNKTFGKTDITGYAGYTQGLNKKNLDFEASYNFALDAKFKVKGIGLSKNQTWVGAGVLNEVSSKFAWYLNYDGKIDKKAKNNVFTAGMRVNF